MKTMEALDIAMGFVRAALKEQHDRLGRVEQKDQRFEAHKVALDLVEAHAKTKEHCGRQVAAHLESIAALEATLALLEDLHLLTVANAEAARQGFVRLSERQGASERHAFDSTRQSVDSSSVSPPVPRHRAGWSASRPVFLPDLRCRLAPHAGRGNRRQPNGPTNR